eukprot:8366590-Prorocentrum_lima.AAC.1
MKEPLPKKPRRKPSPVRSPRRQARTAYGPFASCCCRCCCSAGALLPRVSLPILAGILDPFRALVPIP